MIYEGLGVLLSRGGDVLAGGLDDPNGERAQRQVRMLASLMSRAGVVLPMMFAALDEELDVLSATRDDLRRALAGLGHEQHDSDGGASPVAPLDALRRLWVEIDEVATTLHGLDPHDPPVAAARARMRRGLASAFEIEGRLVDAMLAA